MTARPTPAEVLTAELPLDGQWATDILAALTRAGYRIIHADDGIFTAAELADHAEWVAAERPSREATP